MDDDITAFNKLSVGDILFDSINIMYCIFSKNKDYIVLYACNYKKLTDFRKECLRYYTYKDGTLNHILNVEQ